MKTFAFCLLEDPSPGDNSRMSVNAYPPCKRNRRSCHYSQAVMKARRLKPFVCNGNQAIRHIKLVLSSAVLSIQH